MDFKEAGFRNKRGSANGSPMSCSRVVYTFFICAETHWLCGSQRKAVTPMAPHGRPAEELTHWWSCPPGGIVVARVGPTEGKENAEFEFFILRGPPRNQGGR